MERKVLSPEKSYSPQEEKWNVASHALGLLLLLPAEAFLLWRMPETVTAFVAGTVYLMTAGAMFLGSSLYHAEPAGKSRQLLRRFDHAAIYLLIAGTYTPLMLVGIPGNTSMVALALAWLIALVGVPLELAAVKPFRGFSILLYLIDGWMSLMTLPQMLRVSPAGLGLLIGGGAVYSLGVIFYLNRRCYSHAVWHFFVLGGVALHYSAIVKFVSATI